VGLPLSLLPDLLAAGATDTTPAARPTADLPPGREKVARTEIGRETRNGKRRRASTPVQTEADFQNQVIQLATLHGWKCVHFPDSRRVSCPGWPDLVLGHERRGVIFAELKRQGKKPRPSQVWWCEVLRLAGCRVCVWRPGDWGEVVRVLTG
jgi:hypothetical protein